MGGGIAALAAHLGLEAGEYAWQAHPGLDMTVVHRADLELEVRGLHLEGSAAEARHAPDHGRPPAASRAAGRRSIRRRSSLSMTAREGTRSRPACAAERLARFFSAAVELMTVLARATGHRHVSEFTIEDLTTFKSDMAELTGVAYGGVGRS